VGRTLETSVVVVIDVVDVVVCRPNDIMFSSYT